MLSHITFRHLDTLSLLDIYCHINVYLNYRDKSLSNNKYLFKLVSIHNTQHIPPPVALSVATPRSALCHQVGSEWVAQAVVKRSPVSSVVSMASVSSVSSVSSVVSMASVSSSPSDQEPVQGDILRIGRRLAVYGTYLCNRYQLPVVPQANRLIGEVVQSRRRPLLESAY